MYTVKEDAELGDKRKEKGREKEKDDSELSASMGDSKSEMDSKGSKTLVYRNEVDEHFNLPITVAIVILLIYILLFVLFPLALLVSGTYFRRIRKFSSYHQLI